MLAIPAQAQLQPHQQVADCACKLEESIVTPTPRLIHITGGGSSFDGVIHPELSQDRKVLFLAGLGPAYNQSVIDLDGNVIGQADGTDDGLTINLSRPIDYWEVIKICERSRSDPTQYVVTEFWMLLDNRTKTYSLS